MAETVTVTMNDTAEIVVQWTAPVDLIVTETGPIGPPGEGLADHVADPDPHSQYLLVDEADARYAQLTGISYRHVQSTPSTVWNITHTLPYRPNVAVAIDVGSGMEEVTTDVAWPSDTTVVVRMAVPYAGEAYLS